MTAPDRDRDANRLATESLRDHDPTGWFERLYVAARDGRAVVPWDRGAPQPLLVQWAEARGLDGRRQRAVVVGCGLGADAEYVAGLGFRVVAFDVSPAAVRTARERFPGSPVRYVAADLLDPPTPWSGAFDLVVESFTVQALPDPPRARAIAHVADLVAPGGTLVVVAAARDEHEAADGPPWPLTRGEVDAFAAGRLRTVRIDDIRAAGHPADRRWRGEFRRPAGG